MLLISRSNSFPNILCVPILSQRREQYIHLAALEEQQRPCPDPRRLRRPEPRRRRCPDLLRLRLQHLPLRRLPRLVSFSAPIGTRCSTKRINWEFVYPPISSHYIRNQTKAYRHDVASGFREKPVVELTQLTSSGFRERPELVCLGAKPSRMGSLSPLASGMKPRIEGASCQDDKEKSYEIE